MLASRDADIVLLVDDAPENLAVLSDMLEEQNYLVFVANSGERAIESVRRARPDVILLDAVMPGIDGFETCRRLKSDPASRDVPVIFMTGLTDTEHVLAGFKAGGVDYVTKPVNPEVVIARIAAHVRSARSAMRARDALGSAGISVIVLDASLKKVWQTACAAELLDTFFAPVPSESELPGEILAWLKQIATADRASTPEKTILHVVVDGRALRLRWVAGAPKEETLIMLDVVSDSAAVEPMAKHNLTPRECEVLMWVAKGKTNRDIGEILSLSPRTVNKHLEHIFDKLGVETRTAAAAMALRLESELNSVREA